MKALFLLPFIFAHAAHAADFSHCQKYVDTFQQYKVKGFKIDANGNFSAKSTGHGYSYELKNGVHKYTAGQGAVSYEQEAITKDGRLQSIVTTESFSNTPNDHYKRETVSFDIKNDICYPKESVTEEKTPHATNAYMDKKEWSLKRTLNWHTEMCKELSDYVLKNPKMFSCNCGDLGANKAILQIMQKFDPNFKVGEASKDSKELAKAYAVLNPVLASATERVQTCGNKGLNSALDDKNLWKKQPASSDDGNGGTESVGTSDAG